MKRFLHFPLCLLLLMVGTKVAAQQVVLHYPDGRQLKLHVSELDSISMHPDDWQDPTGAPNRVRMTLVADFEGGNPKQLRGAHKIHIGTDPLVSSERTMLWDENDAIWAIQSSEGSQSSHQYKLSNGKDSRCGEFEVVLNQTNESSFTAIYPYQSDITSSTAGAVTNLTLPSHQRAVAGGCDPRAALMMANVQLPNLTECATTSVAMGFKNICSYIQITPSVDLSNVAITAHDDESAPTYLAGTISVNYNNGAPSWTLVENTGRNTVCISDTLKAGQTYYIAVLPGIKSKGFSITCTKQSLSSTRSYDSSASFVRSKYHDCSGLTTDGTADPAYVDMELTDNGIHRYWATRNLGAATPSDFGSYFAWGEVDGKKAWDNYNFTWPKYKWGDGNEHDIQDISQASFVNKYKSSDQLQLEAADDAAYQLWSAGWQMPTKADFDALLTKCQREYTANYKHTGVNGFIIYKASHQTVKNDSIVDTVDGAEVAHIFLPFGGYKQDGGGTVINPSSVHGYYWSSTVEEAVVSGPDCYNYSRAYDLMLGRNDGTTSASVNADFRRGGQNIRAVYVGPR